ncbi:MAG: chromosomal replication initiator protein DnaA [Myxococcales bacterium]|nr:chromosomal replication initiator protein DnaA [Myxococcales bacterium]MCB9520154.1 chromosomal replication initiator protein DnaA [Myxococcales bacterium]MCB9531224.1 chromosomal replication initiator protein DnaA [Myxococcales bacterium]MCB9534301.1 chromosomal replication initiator protein DnaA [Myxococcales bacterium]
MHELWNATREALKEQVGEAFFASTFESLRAGALRDDVLELRTPDEMVALVVEKNHRPLIERSLRTVSGRKLRVSVTTADELAETVEDESQLSLFSMFAAADAAERAPVEASLPLQAAALDARVSDGAADTRRRSSRRDVDTAVARSGLSTKFQLGSFVVGASNEFAYEAARAVVEHPGQIYNPLFLYGGVGLGKTHLMNAVGFGILQRDPSARIRYLSAETFVNDLIESIGSRRMDEFRQRNRSDVDVLLIDDVQFIAGKERTQEEFFHTFNALYQAGRQIIVTSDRIPQEMPELEERLVSRLTMGLIADIQPPDFETRVAILRRKAKELGFEVPTVVCEYIAQQIRANVRELHGALLRVGSYARLRGEPLSLSLAQMQLDRVHRDRSAGVTAETVLRVTADVFGVPAKELKGRKRAATVALPRKVAMYVARQCTSASFPELGEVFGGRDHTTILSAVRSVERMLAAGDPVRAKVEAVERRLSL